MYDYQLANASGAVLISKKMFDTLSPDLRDLLLSTGKNYMGRLTQMSRKENKEAIETLKKNGIIVQSPPSKETLLEYKKLGQKARRTLVGKVYSQELLDKVEKALEEYRSKPKR
jgi:TRAP-type C4-dicarboxylate transport system substrate-binding protein